MLDDDTLTWAKLFKTPEGSESNPGGYGDIAPAFNQEFQEFLQIVIPFVEDSFYLTGTRMSIRDLLDLTASGSSGGSL
jgi:hypothetical protein